MNSIWIWIIIAAVMVGVELATGTFYLLVLGVAALCGAAAAFFEIGLVWQIFAACIAGLLGSYFVRQFHRSVALKNGPEPHHESNPNVNPDIGQTVQVTAWDAAGRARVQYRGSQWDAMMALGHSSASDTGQFRIAQVQGAMLLLEPLVAD